MPAQNCDGSKWDLATPPLPLPQSTLSTHPFWGFTVRAPWNKTPPLQSRQSLTPKRTSPSSNMGWALLGICAFFPQEWSSLFRWRWRLFGNPPPGFFSRRYFLWNPLVPHPRAQVPHLYQKVPSPNLISHISSRVGGLAGSHLGWDRPRSTTDVVVGINQFTSFHHLPPG